jgi:hypothetical protein
VELNDQQLQSFINLYQQEFGIMLTLSEAQIKASSLLYFMAFCLEPLAKTADHAIHTMPDFS